VVVSLKSITPSAPSSVSETIVVGKDLGMSRRFGYSINKSTVYLALRAVASQAFTSVPRRTMATADDPPRTVANIRGWPRKRVAPRSAISRGRATERPTYRHHPRGHWRRKNPVPCCCWPEDSCLPPCSPWPAPGSSRTGSKHERHDTHNALLPGRRAGRRPSRHR
jgi:hypothetical protein